jgi:4,5-dihydroxyphthalate decarboxylase
VEIDMPNLRLTLAMGDYDHVRDLALERVRAPGIDLTVLNYDVEEIFFRFHDRLEWDVSELSMGMYTSAISRGDDRFIAIPVFPSRVFRHSAIYVRAGSGITDPSQLAAKTVGCPQWSQTATIYVRGFLAETAGVPLSSINWVQAGVNDPGRPEPSILCLPEDIRLQQVADSSLNDMLIDGRIDAIISARPPRGFLSPEQPIVRLFADYQPAEHAYFAQTGIFPIMHTVAIKRSVYEANRWIARNLYVALNEAKERSVKRMLDLTAAHIPVPWATHHAKQAGVTIFGDGPYWPYGITPNRTTLDAFLRFGFEQGTCHRQLAVEELFAEEALAEILI